MVTTTPSRSSHDMLKLLSSAAVATFGILGGAYPATQAFSHQKLAHVSRVLAKPAYILRTKVHPGPSTGKVGKETHLPATEYLPYIKISSWADLSRTRRTDSTSNEPYYRLRLYTQNAPK